MWLFVAALALPTALGPARIPALEPRRDASGACVLSASPDAAPCACGELPTDVRLVRGVPLPLAHVSIDDLERLPGIGPRRAAAIVDERTRLSFDSLDDLRRVHGIGAVTLRSLAPYLFVGTPDPACAQDGARPHS